MPPAPSQSWQKSQTFTLFSAVCPTVLPLPPDYLRLHTPLLPAQNGGSPVLPLPLSWKKQNPLPPGSL